MPGLLAVVHHAARVVTAHHPQSVLRVGDFSLEHGGPIPGHHSHQNGRDVDLGFYALDTRNRPVISSQFLAFDGAGQAVSSRGIRFDDARNWTLLNALLTNPRAEVRSIFVAFWLRTRLLRYGESIGSAKSVLERAAAIMMQPPNAEPHDDHFHIRIGCVQSQRGTICRDDSRVPFNASHGPRPITPAEAATDRLATSNGR